MANMGERLGSRLLGAVIALTLSCGFAWADSGTSRPGLEPLLGKLDGYPQPKSDGDWLDRALTLNRLGLDAADRGDYAKALDLDNKSYRIYKAILGDEHRDTLTALSKTAGDFAAMGQFGDAAAREWQVLEARAKIAGEKDPDTLLALNNYALYLEYLGRPAEAEPLFRRALILQTEVTGETDRDTLAVTNNLAAVLNDLGHYSEAEPLDRRVWMLRAQSLGEKNRDTILSLNNLAADLRALGRLTEAEAFDRRVLALRTEVLGEKHPDTISSLNNLAVDLEVLGRLEEAEPLLRRALDQTREVLGAGHPDTIESIGNLGGVLFDLKRFDEAAALQRQVLNLYTQTLGETSPQTLLAMSNLAASLAFMGQAAQAETLFAKVATLRARQLGDLHPDTLFARENLAAVQLLLPGRAHLALSSARLAKVGRAANYTALGSLGLRGESQQRRQERGASQSDTLFADAAWAAGPGLTAQERAAGVKVMPPTELDKLRLEVFGALQQAAGGPAARAIAETAAKRYAAAQGAGALVDQRRALAYRYLGLEKRQADAQAALSGPDMRAIAAVRAEMDKIEVQLQSLDDDLASRAPRYFAIVNQPSLGLREAQAMLAPDEAVLLVVPTPFGTQLMVASKEGLTWQRSKVPENKINAMVHVLRCDLNPAGEQGCAAVAGPAATQDAPATRSAQRTHLASFDRKTAHDLYAALIEPISGAIAGKSNLYIAATGSLASLPFGVLVSEAPAPGSDDGAPDTLRHTPWFADQHALVQIPSLQALAYLRTYNRHEEDHGVGTDGFVGYGDPLLSGVPQARGNRSSGTLRAVDAVNLEGSGVTSAGAPLMNPARLRELPRLPGTQSELAAMREAFHAPESALHMESGMTEAALKTASADGSLSRVRVLSLATHGIAAHELGLAEPGLVFTPPNVASDADDGYLSASEVVGLDLTGSQWVILSACNTAAPSDRGEPGLSGLARAFFYAGAPTLLVSHWPVFDDVAARLTVDTLKRAQASGTSRAQALQQAMIAVRNDTTPAHAHPGAWAPFVIVGEGR